MQERELKVELLASEADALATALKPPRAIRLQENTYLDTSEGTLRNLHNGLRLRAEWKVSPAVPLDHLLDDTGIPEQSDRLGEPQWTLTLKGPTAKTGALHTRREEELSVEPGVGERICTEGLDPAWLQWPPLRRLAMKQPPALHSIPRDLPKDLQECSPNRRILYVPLGSIRTLRQQFECPASDESAPGWIDLDVTRYPDGSWDHELELEFEEPLRSLPSDLDRPDPGQAILAAETLLRSFLSNLGIPWRPSRDGKFSRFLARQQTGSAFRQGENQEPSK